LFRIYVRSVSRGARQTGLVGVVLVAVLVFAGSASAVTGQMKAKGLDKTLAPDAVSAQEDALLGDIENHLLERVDGISHLDWMSFVGACVKKPHRPYRCPMWIDVTLFNDHQFSHIVCALNVLANRETAWLAATTCPSDWFSGTNR